MTCTEALPDGWHEPGDPLELLTLADCAAAPGRGYIVKGILAPGDLGLLIGLPGAGKSVLAPYMAHGIASGREIFGCRVRPGPVLYIAAEDGIGMKLRATALLRLHGEAGNLRIVADPIDLQGDGINDAADLEAITRAADRIGAVLIIIDTMSKSFPALDENDGRSMGRATRILRSLCTPQRAVLAVHHLAKNGGDTPRGHGVLNGDADVTMKIETGEDGERRVTLGKNRNGSTLQRMAFTIRSEFLSRDEDGDPITAPVAEEVETDAEGGNKRPVLSPQARAAVERLADLVGTTGNILPTGAMFPSNTTLRGVTWEAWRKLCRERPICASQEKTAVNTAFRRAAQTLLDRHMIAAAEHDGHRLVWLCRSPGA
jgi:hypothetical protein